LSLFSPDIAQLVFDRRANMYVQILLLACVAVFTTELCVASLARRGYFLSFFWVLDVVATVSIAISIPYEELGPGMPECNTTTFLESNDFVT